MRKKGGKKEDESCLMIDTRVRICAANVCLIVSYLRGAEPAAMWDGSRWKRVKRKENY